MTFFDYAIILGFLLVMALVGLAVSRLIVSADDLFVAGRELAPFILCATITATNISMLHFVGMGGTAYQSGVSIAWQNWAGDIALVLSGLFVLPVMRRLKIRSIPEFLEMRYSTGMRTLIGAFWGIKLCTFLGILLYIAATAALIITDAAPTFAHYCIWLAVFSLISVTYSAIGGAWAVAVMDSVQFVVLLGGALIVLPIATRAAGGMPAVIHQLRDTGHGEQLSLVPSTGEFNWLFICAITLLSLKWSTVEQTILQRAFGARSPRAGAQGMVLSAIITTPFAFFWILPGLAAAKLHPGFSNPDYAIPWLLAKTIPPVGRGLLGVVLCGLIAAQVSNITSDVNSVATLFTSDVYRTLIRRLPSQRELLVAVRISSLLCGVVMLAVAYILHSTGAGAVRANLTVVGIVDMPLFVVTIVYGLLWKRANWQGATAGFLAGGLIGVLTYALVTPRYFDGWIHPLTLVLSAPLTTTVSHWHDALASRATSIRSIVPLISSATALLVTPLVSLVTPSGHGGDGRIWTSFRGTGTIDGAAIEADTFGLIPSSIAGRLGVGLVLSGFATFLVGVISASWHNPQSAMLAVGGMLVVFVGGLLRVYNQ
jgi:SSS family solute:Na+ symporter